MTDLPYTEETVELLARVIADRAAPPSQHGQLCPVWARKQTIEACDCWILERRRGDAFVALGFLAEAGLLREPGGAERTEFAYGVADERMPDGVRGCGCTGELGEAGGYVGHTHHREVRTVMHLGPWTPLEGDAAVTP